LSSSSGTTVTCGGYIDLSVDDGASSKLVHECPAGPGDWWAESPDPAATVMTVSMGMNVQGSGCSNDADHDLSLTFTLDTDDSALTYIDASGVTFSNPYLGAFPPSIQVTSVGPVGGTVDGTFSAMVQSQTGMHSVSGSFHLCRVQ
jgi:hypothetical protein